jgi:major vault protein
MANDRSPERSDLVLNPNEFVFVQERSKGVVSVNVGPFRSTMSETDQAVLWDSTTRRFVRADQQAAVQIFVTANDGQYVVLANPVPGNEPYYPEVGRSSSAISLATGRRVVRAGPLHFPLWPGQVAQVIDGHQLRSNEYLLVRVCNAEDARAHWAELVVQTAENNIPTPITPDSLRTGQVFVIRGGNVAFFMPSTGLEVLAAADGTYVRQAVTLEALEYCILLDETGNRRYEQGPAVVFPEPAETFVIKDGRTKFRATELTLTSGVHVKVIAAYSDADRDYHVGEELFITGADQPIYFPREEHLVIKSGDGPAVVQAVTVPKGHGRYMLDLATGDVQLRRGPLMLLPDPRRERLVQRVLDARTVDLWYPGNEAARAYNSALRREQERAWESDHPVVLAAAATTTTVPFQTGGENLYNLVSTSPPVSRSIVAPHTRRDVQHDEHAITLDDRFSGAVSISPWPGYAVQIVSKTGERKVVLGPESVLLEFDESLTTLSLSTGTPKSDTNPRRTVYLRVKNNRVSDLVSASTKDLVPVKIRLAYRLDFMPGFEDCWFSVENYIQHLCENAGSRIRNAVKRLGIEEFHNNPVDIVRTTILGDTGTGLQFEENGMRVHELEILGVEIDNPTISTLLVTAQHETVQQTLRVAQSEEEVLRVERLERAARSKLQALEETEEWTHRIHLRRLERDRTKTEQERSLAETRETADREFALRMQPLLDGINRAEVERNRREQQVKLELKGAESEIFVTQLRAQLEAVSPELLKTITAIGDQQTLERVAAHLAPLMLLRDENVQSLLQRYAGEQVPIASLLQRIAKAQEARSS